MKGLHPERRPPRYSEEAFSIWKDHCSEIDSIENFHKSMPVDSSLVSTLDHIKSANTSYTILIGSNTVGNVLTTAVSTPLHN